MGYTTTYALGPLYTYEKFVEIYGFAETMPKLGVLHFRHNFRIKLLLQKILWNKKSTKPSYVENGPYTFSYYTRTTI